MSRSTDPTPSWWSRRDRLAYWLMERGVWIGAYVASRETRERWACVAEGLAAEDPAAEISRALDILLVRYGFRFVESDTRDGWELMSPQRYEAKFGSPV